MSTLIEILRDKLIPWSRHNAAERFIVGRPIMNVDDMPDGVQLKRQKIISKRVVVKNLRLYNNTRGVAATWPEAGLNEVNKLKLACVFDGHVNYQLGNYKVQCGPGHFILIPPGMPHPDGSQSYVDTEKSTFCNLVFFVHHPNAIECWVRHYDQEGPQQGGKYVILHERVVSLFHLLMEEIVDGGDHSSLIAADLLPGFFSMVERELKADRYHSVRSNAQRWLDRDTTEQSRQDDFSEKLKLYLQANLQKGLTLEKVAKELYQSRAQFARNVRRETGQSFNELLTAYRIEEAKALLRDSQWTVSAISYFVGFKSPSYFRTFFYKHTQQTPTQFRQHLIIERKTNGVRR